MQTSPPTVFVRNATLSFQGTLLFNNLNLTLRAGEWTCLLGASGVGKSTLLRLIANLIPMSTPDGADMTCDNAIPLASQIAYMGQADLLLPWLSVLDNVLLGARLRGKKLSPMLKNKARDLLIQANLRKALALYPHQLSGGMRQRVALVRTLMEEKPIVLMDEPFSALDTITRLTLQTLAAKLLKNRTVLFVTHDPLEALRLANKIYVMYGEPVTLYSPFDLNSLTPRDPYDTEVLARQADLFRELEKVYAGNL